MTDKINLSIIYGICILVILTATFSLGYSCSAYKYKLEIETIKTAALAEQAKALEDKNSKEKSNYEIITSAQSKLFTQTSDIQKNYSVLSNSILFNDSDSLQYSDNTSSNASVPNDAGSTKPVQESTCKCNADNRTRLQRLYRQQLEVARDCDITATHYNELIDIYKGVQ